MSSVKSAASGEENPIAANRANIVSVVAAHLTGGPGAWATLPAVLKVLLNNTKVEELFSKAELEQKHGESSRQAEGPEGGLFQVAFFAFGPGYPGIPHQHRGINCVSAVLEGPIAEVLYNEGKSLEEGKDGPLTAQKVEIRDRGSIVADIHEEGQPPFIHRLLNPGDTVAHTVHVYGIGKEANADGRTFNKYYAPATVTNKSFVDAEVARGMADRGKGA